MALTTVQTGGMFSGFSNGINAADHYAMTTNFTASGDTVINNTNGVWYRVNAFGGGVSEDDGEFTFPSTGLYLIIYGAYINSHLDNSNRGYRMDLRHSTDSGSNYTRKNFAMFSMQDFETAAQSAYFSNHYFLDVTNATNERVQFQTSTAGGGSNGQVSTSWGGSSTESRTNCAFFRIGDT